MNINNKFIVFLILFMNIAGHVMVASSGIHSSDLRNAALQGNAAAIKNLITLGALVNNADNMGWTPLHFAVYKGSLESVLELVRAGANVNAQAFHGKITPTMLSSRNPNPKIKAALQGTHTSLFNTSSLFARNRNQALFFGQVSGDDDNKAMYNQSSFARTRNRALLFAHLASDDDDSDDDSVSSSVLTAELSDDEDDQL